MCKGELIFDRGPGTPMATGTMGGRGVNVMVGVRVGQRVRVGVRVRVS
jgi:hypothetical protein